MFYLKPNRNNFAGKFIRFPAVLREYIMSDLKFVKWGYFSSEAVLENEWSLLLNIVGFETLPENIKLIDKQLQVRSFDSFIFWSKFCFLGLFRAYDQLWWLTFLPSLPRPPTNIKKLLRALYSYFVPIPT